MEERLDALAAALHARSSKPWAPGTRPAVAVVLRRPASIGPSIAGWLAERQQTIADSVRTRPAGVPLLVTEYVNLAAYGPLAPAWLRPGVPKWFPLPEALESGTGPGT